MYPIHRRTNSMLQHLPCTVQVTYRVNTLNRTFLDTRRKDTDTKLNCINQVICSNCLVNVLLLLSLPNILILSHFPMTHHHLSLQKAVIKIQFVVRIMFRIPSFIRLTYIIQQTGTSAIFYDTATHFGVFFDHIP
jgi:hypothetical protein